MVTEAEKEEARRQTRRREEAEARFVVMEEYMIAVITYALRQSTPQRQRMEAARNKVIDMEVNR